MITWHRGYCTQTIATVVIYALQSDTSVTVTCSGGSVAMSSSSPGSTHKVYLATITGLSANTTYSITINVDAESATGTVKTAPVTGSSFNIGFLGCTDNARDSAAIYKLQQRYAPLYTLLLGDIPYMDQTDQSGANVKWGGITTVHSTSSQAIFENVDTYMDHYKSMWNMPCMRQIGHNSAILMMPDDHDWGDDDFSGANIGVVGAVSGLTWSQAHFDAAEEAFTAALIGNPPNAVTSDTDAEYFSLAVNDDVLIVVPDYIKYRVGFDGDGYTGTAADTALGANQKEWLIGTTPNFNTGIIHESNTFKIIGSTKRYYADYAEQADADGGSGPRRNIDGFHSNGDERDDVVEAINNTTGVIVMSTDRHNTAAFSREGATEYAELGFPSATRTPHKPQGNGFSSSHVKWRCNTHHGFGLIEVNGSNNLVIKACNERGAVMWKAERRSTDNIFYYPAIGTATGSGSV